MVKPNKKKDTIRWNSNLVCTMK